MNSVRQTNCIRVEFYFILKISSVQYYIHVNSLEFKTSVKTSKTAILIHNILRAYCALASLIVCSS
jgi:hypothetical protein